MTEKEVMDVILKGAAAGCTEALLTFGESPDTLFEFNDRFEKTLTPFDSFADYVAHLSRLCLKNGLLPHTNGGIFSQKDLELLAPLNAGMGLMLETTANISAHENCPGKIPSARLDFIKRAGKMRIPFTTGLLIGIGETRDDRIQSLYEIKRLHEKYGHIQEVILQNYTPNAGHASDLKPPSKEEMKDVIIIAKEILPSGISLQVPPNLITPKELIRCGVTDLGGISPITIDYINPEAAWPKIEELTALLKSDGYELKERLPIYPRYVKNGWGGKETLGLIQKLSDENGYRKNV
jgi:FO synthase subunit 1